SYSFFFSSRRRHTRFSRDWSSDVCSSDLDGRDAEYAISRGFDVHPSDGSPNMARLAGERLGFDVPVLRFSELEAVEAFDAVWCQATLLHLAEDELPAVVTGIHQALRPGGLHWASFKGG